MALLLAHLFPLWALAHVPTQDGPARVENAMALLRRSRVPVLTEYDELHLHLVHGRAIEGEGALPCRDLDAGGSGIRIDAVLVWGPPAMPARGACVRAWQAQLWKRR